MFSFLKKNQQEIEDPFVLDIFTDEMFELIKRHKIKHLILELVQKKNSI